jgi:hypothetical protein
MPQEFFCRQTATVVGSGIAENRKSKEANGGKSWKSIEGIL